MSSPKVSGVRTTEIVHAHKNWSKVVIWSVFCMMFGTAIVLPLKLGKEAIPGSIAIFAVTAGAVGIFLWGYGELHGDEFGVEESQGVPTKRVWRHGWYWLCPVLQSMMKIMGKESNMDVQCEGFSKEEWLVKSKLVIPRKMSPHIAEQAGEGEEAGTSRQYHIQSGEGGQAAEDAKLSAAAQQIYESLLSGIECSRISGLRSLLAKIVEAKLRLRDWERLLGDIDPEDHASVINHFAVPSNRVKLEQELAHEPLDKDFSDHEIQCGMVIMPGVKLEDLVLPEALLAAKQVGADVQAFAAALEVVNEKAPGTKDAADIALVLASKRTEGKVFRGAVGDDVWKKSETGDKK